MRSRERSIRLQNGDFDVAVPLNQAATVAALEL
jgi:hypothetical protein